MMKKIIVAILFVVGISFGPGEDFALADCPSGMYNGCVRYCDFVRGPYSNRKPFAHPDWGYLVYTDQHPSGGLVTYPGIIFDGACEIREADKEVACDHVPDDLKALSGCPLPEATPEEKCSQYQNLFDPPSGNCLFQVEYGTKCVDGAGTGIYYEYRVRASDGRTSDWQNSHTSTGNIGVECISYESQCNNPEGCWVPSDLDRCVYKDSDGNIKMKPECWVDSSSPPESGWSDLCDMGVVECPPKGGDDGGGGTPGGGGDDGGGGGTPGGGGDNGGGGGTPGGGDNGGGGSTPGGGDNGGGGGTPGGGDSGGGGSSGGGGDTPGGTGGGGGGTGGGSSGIGDSDKGEEEGFDGNFGSSGDAASAANEGGWGDGKGDYTIDRGQGEHKDYLDGLMGKGPVQEIKNHDYVQTSGATCSMNVVLFSRNFTFSLCEYQDKIRLFGQLIFSITGLCGLLLVLRR